MWYVYHAFMQAFYQVEGCAPLTGLSLGLQVVGVNPGFATLNDIQKKAGVIGRIFF